MKGWQAAIVALVGIGLLWVGYTTGQEALSQYQRENAETVTRGGTIHSTDRRQVDGGGRRGGANWYVLILSAIIT